MLRLAEHPLEPGDRYFERHAASAAERLDPSEPVIHAEASVHDCVLGPWTRVGARTSLSEVTMGAYSYIVNDASATYAQIGKFCSIARDARINPGNHPTWKAAQHHFSYRAVSYGLSDADDQEFFEWRRAHRVVLGHDVWIGHGATVLPGVTIGTGAVVGGVPSHPIHERFPKAVQDGLLALAWWDWSHERLAQALKDFRRLEAHEFVEKHS